MRKQTILLATGSDDTKEIIASRVARMDEVGMIVTCTSYKEVIGYMQRFPADVLISENRSLSNNPRQWGEHLVTEIRERWPDTRNILMSADPKLKNHPCIDGFLEKPLITTEAVQGVVIQALYK